MTFLIMERLLIKRKNIEYEVLFDKSDSDLINKYRWHIDQDGYAVGYRRDVPTTCKKWFKMHRLILGVHFEKYPVIDHINRNKIDNRRNNLRICTVFENAMNNKIIGKSKYRGVTVNGKKYCARITVNGERFIIGLFDSEAEAGMAYINAVKKYYSEETLNYLNERV